MVPNVDKNDSSRFPGAGKSLSQLVNNKPDKNQGADKDNSARESEAGTPADGSPRSGAAAGAVGYEPGTEEAERVLITQRYKIEFTAGPAFMEKLDIKSLNSTKYPGGLSLEAVFDIAVTEYLDRRSTEGRIERRNSRKRGGSGEKRGMKKSGSRREMKLPEHRSGSRTTEPAYPAGNQGRGIRS
jgi:hypothetical protein